MTATKQFIKDAIEGGWNPKPMYYIPWMKTISDAGIWWNGGDGDKEYYHIHYILLKPEVWQAVGKTRGWRYPESKDHWITATDMETSVQTFNGEWMQNWQDFIQWIANGKTIEEALSAMSH